jgi:hypothetical protein
MLVSTDFRRLFNRSVRRRNRGSRRAVRRQPTEQLESRCLLAAAPVGITVTRLEIPFDTGVNLTSIADLNGDGVPDVAVATRSGVSVLPGNGDGTFATRVDYGGFRAARVELQDVDGMRGPDLVAVSGSGNHAQVRFNDDQGNFGLRRSFDIGSHITDLEVVDLNQDGELDFVALSPGRSSIYVTYGEGNGFFSAPVSFNSGGGTTFSLGDFNADGRTDVVVGSGLYSNAPKRFSVLLGRDGNLFDDPVQTSFPDGVLQVETADVNADGYLDLLLRRGGGDADIAFVPGNGDGTFGTLVPITVGDSPSDLWVGDIDSDGNTDIVTANQRGHSISVVTGRGDGSFAQQRRYTVLESPQGLRVGDIDNDGRLDIVAIGLTAGRSDPAGITVRLADDQGGFSRRLDLTPSGSTINLRDVDLTDLDGDGDLDLVVTNSFSDFTGLNVFLVDTDTLMNRPPVVGPIDAQRITSGTELRLTVTATDPDGDSITFALDEGAPVGMTIDPATGVITWTPTREQVREEPYVVMLTATDDGDPALSASVMIEILVEAPVASPPSSVNRAPDLAGIADQNLEEGTQLALDLTATDPDDDRLFFVLEDGAPEGLRVNPLTGRLTWTPTEAQGPGQFEITVQVYDGDGAFDSESFTVNVGEVNDAPRFPDVLLNIPPAAEGRTFNYTLPSVRLTPTCRRTRWRTRC